MATKRIDWIDSAKGIGLLLVIIGHLGIPYIEIWIYLFHMPLFFFLSGAVFSGDKYDLKDYLIRKVKSILIPYFSLGLIIYLFYIIFNAITNQNSYGSNSEMIVGFIKQDGFWTVWFLACLFITEIIYYFINKTKKCSKYLPTVISVGLCVLALVLYRFVDGFDGLPWNIDVAFVAQFFFHCGYLFRQNDKLQKFFLNKKTGIFVLIAGASLLINVVVGFVGLRTGGAYLNMAVGIYGNEVCTMIAAFAGIMLTIVVANKFKCKIFTYLGRNTMIIFAWHSRIIIVLCNYLYKVIGIFSGSSMLVRCERGLVTFVIVLAVLIPVTELVKRTKIHSWFGV